MDKAETNGYLRAINAQLQALEKSIAEIDRDGDLNDEAHAAFVAVKLDLINIRQSYIKLYARAWNR